jgi:glycosyltransferase involved in cell wall biosynthesis
MSRRFRLAVVNSHPIQYFAPLYARLDRSPKLEVSALYCSDWSLRGGRDPGFGRAVTWDVDLLSGYRPVFLGDAARRRTPGGFWSLVCPELWPELRSGRYDGVLVHGYGFAAYVLAALVAKLSGLKLFYRSETHLGLRRSGWKRWLRDAVLRLAFRAVDGFFAIGSLNRAYYLSLGVAPERIFDVPYTVDNARFIAAAALDPAARAAARRERGLPEQGVVVIYASKLMRRKHPEAVIGAAALLRERGVPVTVYLVGSGEMEAELRAQAAPLGASVVFGGFVNQSELPRAFGCADLFVLPSEDEPWGLIVNEAMCAGLPVVVSAEVGCSADLVEDGATGFRVPAGDARALADTFQRIAEDPALRQRLGAGALARIRAWDYERCAAGIERAVG